MSGRGRGAVVCDACGGELRHWHARGTTEDGKILEGKCRDCGFFARIHLDSDGKVRLIKGARFR